MRHRLEHSEVRTLIIVGVAAALSALSIWAAARTPMTPRLQHLVDTTCPHWSEC